MKPNRTYALLCPIARALDAVGDRWALLILRDLHAGPARYSNLREALPGLAANLLSTRLAELSARGLVERDGPDRGARYRLTELGRRTRPLLFELAQLGVALPAPEDPDEPGNRRHVAVTLAAACERVTPPDLDLRAELVLDDEAFSLVVTSGKVILESGPMLAPPIRYATGYESLGPVVAGQRTFADHLEQDATIDCLDGIDPSSFLDLMRNALAAIGGRTPA